MKLRTLLILNTVIALAFSAGFLIAPGLVSEQYGVEATAAMEYSGRLLGSAILGVAVLTWTARNAQDSTARRAIVLALLVMNVAGFLVTLVGQINGVVNAMGWSTVAIYLLLAIGYGYFQFTKPAPREVTSAAD